MTSRVRLSKLSVGVGMFALTAVAISPALATDDWRTDQPELAPSMATLRGGNSDSLRFAFTPNYSDDLGFSMEGALGGFIADGIAVGAIIEYGDSKQELLLNLGLQLSKSTALIGTVGQLREDLEFVAGSGRDQVKQDEYGVTLQHYLGAGILSGLDLSGYLADANTNSADATAGKVYGFQSNALLSLTSTTFVKLGAGYEWLEWDDGIGDEGRMTGSVEARQFLSSDLSVFGSARWATTEYVYGGGIDYQFDRENTSHRLGVEYTRIDGQEGIESDDRVRATYTIGLDRQPNRLASAHNGLKDSAPVAVPPRTDGRMLDTVMQRPKYLPERVVARGNTASAASCPYYTTDITGQSALSYFEQQDFAGRFVLLFVPTGSSAPSTLELGGNPSTSGPRLGPAGSSAFLSLGI